VSIYYYPFEMPSNKYVHNMRSILSQIQIVKDFPSPKLFYKLFFEKDKDILFLNWVEDFSLRKNIFYYIIWVFYMFLARILFKKIVWVKHNIVPHDSSKSLRFKFMCWVLNKISDVKIAHKPMQDYIFLPHPKYESNYDLLNKKRDIEYLFFGAIKPYKNLVTLLNTWPQETSLCIRGYCNNETLEHEIRDLILTRRLNVSFVNKYITDEELELLLYRTKFVLIPHMDEKMIVSGTFYHAASLGANIVVLNSSFGNFLKDNFKFVSNLNESERQYFEPSLVISDLDNKCSDKVILDVLKKVLI
jgi:beta-1,4-mannosyltransferase